ncbi:MAG: transporter [Rubritepida sp.]|nr:transporter [Rubritepida sp.]
MQRRLFPLALVSALAVPSLLRAQTWPARAIRIIVPVPPGGGTDIISRLIQPQLQERLGQNIVIENRPGGGSTIGTSLVVNAAPDGYTLLMIDSAVAVNPFLYTRLPFNTERDLQPVSLVATAPVILVTHPSFAPTNLADLLAFVRAHPGQVNFASGGNGASTHLSGEMLRMVADIDIVHVPFAGTGPGVTAVLSGTTQMMFAGISSTRQHVETGRLRAIAVTGASRSPALPDVPTFAEAGLPGMSAETIWGLWAPTGTPAAIGERLAREIAALLAIPEIRSRAIDLGFVPEGSTPAQFRERFARELATWGPIVRQSGARVD